MAIILTARRVRAFREKIWRHDRAHRREMPWRGETDPYRVLISEVMLQQTQVDRVRGIYPAFIAAFPDFPALARAPLAAILARWRGLGYNRRAVALRRLAHAVLERHCGILPEDPAILVGLPGLGRATAGSIAVFAFDRPAVFIETNIRRVFLHEFFPRRERVPDAELMPLVARTLEAARPRAWYQALMDYGAVLARRVPNPNRRSTAYVRQSRFEGSDRQLRGRILSVLLETGSMTAAGFGRLLGEDRERVGGLLSRLEMEGLVEKAGRRIRIPTGKPRA